MNDSDAFWPIIIVLICFLLGVWAGHTLTARDYKKSAIEAGVAEWVIDSKTGDREWEYIKGGSDE